MVPALAYQARLHHAAWCLPSSVSPQFHLPYVETVAEELNGSHQDLHAVVALPRAQDAGGVLAP
jgi:hypothetical protein